MMIIGYALFVCALLFLAEFTVKRSRYRWLWTFMWSTIIALTLFSPVIINMYLATLEPKIPELACTAVALGVLVLWINWATWLRKKHTALRTARKQRAAEVIATIEPALHERAQGGYRIATNFARINVTELQAQREMFVDDPEAAQLFERYLKARTVYEQD